MKHVNLTARIGRAVAAVALGASMWAAPALAADYKLMVGSPLPDGHPVISGFNVFKDLVAERTEGAVEIQVFPNGQLGGTQDLMDQALAGGNVAAFTDAARLSDFVPEMSVIGAPYVFNSYEEADAFVVSDKFAEWAEALRENSGYVVLSFNWYQGPRNLMTNKPITSRADVDGLRIRTPGAPAWMAAVRSVGGVPTPLDWGEVYSGLQLGAIDGAESGPAAALSMKFPEVVSHMTKTGHIHLITGLIVGEAWFDQLTPEQQEALKSAAVDAGREMSALNNAADDAAYAELEAMGMTISEIDTAEFVEAAVSEIEALGLTEAYDAVRAALDAN